MTEKELLTQVIAHPAGFEVSLFGIIEARRLESGSYVVIFDEPTDTTTFRETIFEKPENAIDLFLHYRESMGFGFDKETSE